MSDDFFATVQADGIAAIVFGRTRIPRITSDAHQEALLQRAILNHAEDRVEQFHAPLHLPLLVGRAIHPDKQPILAAAAASVLVWSGARLYDNLLDDDLEADWAMLSRADLVFTAFGIATVVPPTLIARLPMEPLQLTRLQDILSRGILELFAGQRDALSRKGAPVDPIAVVETAEGIHGAAYGMAAALGAEAAGADGLNVGHWERYGRALGAVHQLQELSRAVALPDALLESRIDVALEALEATGARGPARSHLQALIEDAPV